jgi:hypothetical protein
MPARYVAALSKPELTKPHRQIAAHKLLAAAERGGIVMLAEIAIGQALAHGQPKPSPVRPRKSREEIQNSQVKDTFDQ